MFNTLQSKLAGALGLLTVLLLVLAGFSQRAISSLHTQFDEVVNGHAVRAEWSHAVLDGVNGRANEARNLIVATDAALRQRAQDALQAHGAQLDASLDKLQATHPDSITPQERALIQKMAEVEQRYHPVATAIVAKAQQGDTDGAIRQLNAECIPLLSELRDAQGAVVGGGYLEMTGYASALVL